MTQFQRQTQIINMIIQIPNTVQPVNGLAVVLTAADVITRDGQPFGFPHQRQQYLISEDITPELIDTLNGSLADIGYKLTPIAEE